MIDRILEFLGLSEEEASADVDEARILHATAVLLVEIERADHERLAVEHDAMLELLKDNFDLSGQKAELVLSRAEDASENSVSLREFTRILHSELSYAEKERVIDMLWRIALADKVLDKYEDYMIGKIADLLYVARGDVIRLRNRAFESLDKHQESGAG